MPAAVILMVTALPAILGQSYMGRMPITAPRIPTLSRASAHVVGALFFVPLTLLPQGFLFHASNPFRGLTRGVYFPGLAHPSSKISFLFFIRGPSGLLKDSRSHRGET